MAQATKSETLTAEAIGAAIDRLAGDYAEAGEHRGEIEAARAEYDTLRGHVFDDDDLFSQHMTMFLEWFVLERATPAGVAPIFEAMAADASADDHQTLIALSRSQRSLFEVYRKLERAVIIEDLIHGGQWRVDCLPNAGLGPKEIFEGRLIPHRGGIVFGPVLLFHPRIARQRIHEMVRRGQGDDALSPELIDRLAEMRLRFGRFRNIAVEHIYKVGSSA